MAPTRITATHGKCGTNFYTITTGKDVEFQLKDLKGMDTWDAFTGQKLDFTESGTLKIKTESRLWLGKN